MRKKVSGKFLIEVALLDFEGKTMRESAEILEVDVNTVRKARHHELYHDIYTGGLKLIMASRLTEVLEKAIA